jgi:hypothetical protein
MLLVTTEAKEKLEETLQEQKADTEIALRLITNPKNPNEFSLTLDKEKKGDLVIRNKRGKKILLLQANLAEEFERMVFDHQDTPQGAYFTLSDPASSSKH